ncbi:hypothetical protein CQW23_12752 [Capsicum baccatum]|uniref:Uncharacterized protein n=1 Tax=Capsicum baccatum TaxID=33114 RepID=A0A2G2WTH7_CAPBA|nr:hypothetical protein CQW23_12752 [Capsicum baccatum]
MAVEDYSESQRKLAVQFGIEDRERKRRKEDEKKECEVLSRSTRKGGLTLLQKIEELEMVEGKDIDLVLDIEEVLQCYSLLNNPVYADIVDIFFMDIIWKATVVALDAVALSIGGDVDVLGPLILNIERLGMDDVEGIDEELLCRLLWGEEG